ANAFLLYDFFTPDGAVNEDVYAYSNRAGEERGLVVYHNRFASARGWIRQSAAYSSRDDGGDGRRLLRKNLAEGLGLRDDPNCFTTFRDALSGLEYIRNNRTLHEQGLYVELDAYRCHVFLDFRQVEDNEWRHLSQLAARLKGRGVTSLDQALREMLLQPLHHAYRELVNAGQLRYLIDNRQARRDAGGEPEVEDGARRVAALDEVEAKATSLLEEIKAFTGQEGDSASLAAEIREDVRSILDLEAPAQPATSTWSDYLRLGEWAEAGEAVIWGPALIWGVTRKLGKLCAPTGASPTLWAQASAACYQDYLLAGVVAEALRNLGMEASTASRHADLMPLLFRYQGWSDGLAGEHPDAPDREHARQFLAGWLENGDVHCYLGVNRHQEATWFNKETFEELLWWLALIESLQAPDRAEAITVLIQAMLEAEAQSGYQVEKLLAALE
ncbi:MAG: hypothetical protein PHD58_11130, partial [Anaerolineales bacterium]|nr:hypothetical protein [Anaerolineales bacterium]